jgi:hypothetical protein
MIGPMVGTPVRILVMLVALAAGGCASSNVGDGEGGDRGAKAGFTAASGRVQGSRFRVKGVLSAGEKPAAGTTYRVTGAVGR